MVAGTQQHCGPRQRQPSIAGSAYSKAEADAKYSPAGSSYSKAEIDAKLAPLLNSLAAFAGGDQLVAMTTSAEVFRSVSIMPPADGTVIVNSSAYLRARRRRSRGSVLPHDRRCP